MNKLQEAKNLIIDKVLLPAINTSGVSQKNINVAKNQIPLINQFNTIGDLYSYLLTATSKQKEHVNEVQQLGLETYETILPLFESKFSDSLSIKTQITDFKYNHNYHSLDFLSVVGVYNYQTPGIQLKYSSDTLEFIIIKVTLTDGKYSNKWLLENKLLQYYMTTHNGLYKESYKKNKAIIESGNIPIHAFVRENNSGLFTYKGKFKYLSHSSDPDGKKWFELVAIDINISPSISTHYDSFQEQVNKSLNDSDAKRGKRLKKSEKNPKPKTRVVSTTVYDRNPDVVAYVLKRAGKFCEKCTAQAPFQRKKDNSPYLEVHHKTRLADGGHDTVENAIALCPNCHREEHYG